jgi:hypothetical protein
MGSVAVTVQLVSKYSYPSTSKLCQVVGAMPREHERNLNVETVLWFRDYALHYLENMEIYTVGPKFQDPERFCSDILFNRSGCSFVRWVNTKREGLTGYVVYIITDRQSRGSDSECSISRSATDIILNTHVHYIYWT